MSWEQSVFLAAVLMIATAVGVSGVTVQLKRIADSLEILASPPKEIGNGLPK